MKSLLGVLCACGVLAAALHTGAGTAHAVQPGPVGAVVAIADVDGNAGDEAVVVTRSSTQSAAQSFTVEARRAATGAVMWSRTVPTVLAGPYWDFQPVQVADVTGDGAAEILVLHVTQWDSGSFVLSSLRGDTGLPLWTVPVGGAANAYSCTGACVVTGLWDWVRSFQVIGDADGDARRDVLLESRVFVVAGAGTAHWFELRSAGVVLSGLTGTARYAIAVAGDAFMRDAGDVNGDGLRDVAYWSFDPSRVGVVAAGRGDLWSADDAAPVFVRTADLDDDPQTELVAQFADGRLAAFDGATGDVQWRFSPDGRYEIVSDVDADGADDIVVLSGPERVAATYSGRTLRVVWEMTAHPSLVPDITCCSDVSGDGVADHVFTVSGGVGSGGLLVDGANGSTRWKVGIPVAMRLAHGDLNANGTADVVSFERSGARRGTVRAHEGRTGDVAWSTEIEVPAEGWAPMRARSGRDATGAGVAVVSIVYADGGELACSTMVVGPAGVVWTPPAPTSHEPDRACLG